MLKHLAAVTVGAGLLAMTPSFAFAQDRDHDEHRDRVFDRDHHDYHEWNAGEERAWHRYWEEQHHAAVEWQRANEEQKRAYWKWRHDHPDGVLWHERRKSAGSK